MNDQPVNQSTKTEILKALLSSSEFITSQKYSDLLTYLVNASINGDIIKESTIAMDFFGKDATFNSSEDSTVRAYISNLRKKLEHFYLTEGKEECIQLTIPKGHYNIVFRVVGKNDNKFFSKFTYHAIYSGLILILLLLVVFHSDIFNSKNDFFLSEDNAIWGDFFNSRTPTIIVLGDYYFFSMQYMQGRQSYIRDVEINSDADLDQFLVTHPEVKEKISKTYNAYLDEHISWCIAKIVPSFVFHNKNYEIKMSSELQLSEMQKYNIIYIGPYKSLNLLKTVTDNLHFKYQLKQGSSSLSFLEQDSSIEHTYDWLSNPETNARNDYAMVLKVTGQNKNQYMFFLSEHDFGNMATVKYFTRPHTLTDFSEKLTSHSFEALFEVTGIIRTDFTIKLLHKNMLHSDFKIALD